jgi:hypothetical protein
MNDDDTYLHDASYWRAQAAEVRIKAEGMHDPLARKLMIGIAESYDKLAERADYDIRKKD